jgi:hypothetical protein
MKKNFFKKLSFVLASAMVLTAVAPASGAFAAKAPKLNSTSKYLHLGREKENEFNFNVSNKKSGWKYEWTSANEDVVKVNKKNGVVKATGVGSTKVAVVITDKDGEEVDELKAKVTVRDNIATVKISNPLTESLAVGAEHDFNRSFVTESGSKKKTSSITRWTVDSEKATINDKGVFAATEAGEYTVTARSFQSKAKYESWLADAEKYASYVLDTDSTKVKVAASMVGAKQVNLDTVKVTFSSPMTEEEVKSNITVSEVVGSTKVLRTISSVKLDDSKMVAEVSIYIPYTAKSVYVIDYKDMEPVQFVATTTEATDVANVKIGTTEAEIGKATGLDVKLYNAEGVDITTDELMYRVTYDTSSATSFLDSDNKLTMFTVGETTVVTAEYHTYDFDPATGEERGNVKVTGTVRCVEEKTIIAEGLKAWTIEDYNDPKFDFTNAKHSLAADDSNKILLVKTVLSDDDKTEVTNGVDDENNKFTFTSSDENVLIVNEDTGEIYAIKAGSAVVVVKYDKKVIGTVTISVGAERKAVAVTLDSYGFTLSNGFDDTKTVEVSVKDQFGEDYPQEDVSYEILTKPSDKTNEKDPSDIVNQLNPEKFDVTQSVSDGKYSYIVNAHGAEAGTYRVRIHANDKYRDFTVTVKTPNSTDKDYFRAEVDKSSVDLKLASDKLEETVTVSIYQYDKSGVKVNKIDTTGKGYKIEIKDPKGNELVYTAVSGSSIYVLASAKNDAKLANGKVVSGAAIKLDKGTYRVKATEDKPNGKVINTTYFNATDSQAAPTFKVDKYVTNDSYDVEHALYDCFTFMLNGKNVDEDSDHIFISDLVTYPNTNKAYIKKVTIREVLDKTSGTYIDHVITVNKNISWKAD